MASGAVWVPLVVNHVRKRRGSLRPHTRYELPLRGLGANDAGERAETSQEQPRSLDGHPRGGGKRRFSRMWLCTTETLRIRRPVASRWLLSPHSQPQKPSGCVGSVVAPEDGNSQVGHGQPEPSKCFIAKRSLREARSLYDQVGPVGRAAQSCDLEPQATLEQRVLQIENALPFHDCAGPNHVITDGQAFSHYGQAKLFQPLWHTRRKFMNVGNHKDHMAKCRFESTEESNEFEKRAPTSHFATAKWQ